MQGSWPIIDDVWKVRIYRIEEACYGRIHLQDIVYPHWVVSYIAEGEVEVTDCGSTTTASAGQVMLHAPGVAFGEKAVVPGRHLWFLAEIKNSMEVDLLRLFPVSELVTLRDPGTYVAIFKQLLNLHLSGSGLGSGTPPFMELQSAGLGLQLIYHLLDSWEAEGRFPRKHGSKKRDERLDTVFAYLHARLSEKVTRDTLAGLVHLNANYLDRIFEETFAMKPMQLLRELRLKQVKRMLEATDEPLSEIAQQCGLGDASYLTHQYIKRFGVSPGKYREQARRAQQSYY
jgi:AraC-like DNA-binding protein